MMTSFQVLLGQNLQLHYETDQDRQYPNAMLEDYRFDKWGATYWFVTMDFKDPNSTGTKSISSMYGEIARYITFPFAQSFSATVQYNDGVYYGGLDDPWASGQVGAIWLGGFSYALPLKTGAAQLDVLGKLSQQAEEQDLQLTLAWFYPFGEGRLQFVGYWDAWSEVEADGQKAVVILAEPQFWYNVWENFDLGLGAEVDYNFPVFLPREWKLYPNLSMRWNF